MQGTFPFSGKLTYDGETERAYASVDFPKINKHMEFGVDSTSGAPTLTGTVGGDSSEPAEILAQAVPEAVENSPWAGPYSFLMDGFSDAARPDLSWGYGFGTAQVAKNGTASLMLTLPDKSTVVSYSPGFINTNTPAIPIFKPLYGNKGFVIGWARFSISEDDSSDYVISSDAMIWYKVPAIAGQTTYTTGFTATSPLYGFSFKKPDATSHARGTLTISGAALPEPVTADWNFNTTKNFVVSGIANANALTLKVNLANGVITGNVTITPVGGKKTVLAISGVAVTPEVGDVILKGFTILGDSSMPFEMSVDSQGLSSGLFEVYGGQDFSVADRNWYLKGYSPSEYGYTLLGESSSTGTFQGAYNVYIIHALPGSIAMVDAVCGSNGAYYGTEITGNTTNPGFLDGPPDGLCAQIGTIMSGGVIYGDGFVVIDATGDHLTSITVKIGE